MTPIVYSYSPEKDFARMQTNDHRKAMMRKVEISVYALGILAIFAAVFVISQAGGVGTLSLPQNVTLIGTIAGAGAAPIGLAILITRLVRFYFSRQNRKLRSAFNGLHLLDSLMGHFTQPDKTHQKPFTQLLTHMTHAQWSLFVAAIDKEFADKKTLKTEDQAFLQFVGQYSDNLVHNLFYLSPQTVGHLRSSMDEKNREHFDFLIESRFESLLQTYGAMEDVESEEESIHDPWLNYMTALSVSFGGMPRETYSLTDEQIPYLRDLCNRGLKMVNPLKTDQNVAE
ncbi:MAG: hypothetical protein S4CHLAM2_00210 [Chlamydiales bacterium]|nr:hypothetical protein [Chlamydiales bacterium]